MKVLYGGSLSIAQVPGRLMGVLFALFSVGCAQTVKTEIEPYSARGVEPVSESEPVVASPKATPRSSEPGWHRLVYEGQVDWDGVFERPIEGAEVGVYEGADKLYTTTTDSKGKFEIPCDLYGSPSKDWRGRPAWKPEPYYAIAAETRNGGFTKKRLSEVEFGKPLHLEITPPK